MQQSKLISLEIDEGTILLIAEVLRLERGADAVDLADASHAVITALKSLSFTPSKGK